MRTRTVGESSNVRSSPPSVTTETVSVEIVSSPRCRVFCSTLSSRPARRRPRRSPRFAPREATRASVPAWCSRRAAGARRRAVARGRDRVVADPGICPLPRSSTVSEFRTSFNWALVNRIVMSAGCERFPGARSSPRRSCRESRGARAGRSGGRLSRLFRRRNRRRLGKREDRKDDETRRQKPAHGGVLQGSRAISAGTPDSRTSIARPARFGGSFHGSQAFGTAPPRARRRGSGRRDTDVLCGRSPLAGPS